MLRKLLILCCCSLILCTCDRAENEPPKTLFTLRTDTGVTSENRLRPSEDLNIIEYLYYYNGGGVAATDINGDGLPDLYFTNNQGENKYYVNEDNFRFRDATEEAGVGGKGDWSTGVSVVDVNGDGLMDIYVCNVSGYKGLEGRNELFIQNPDSTFTDRAAEYGLDFPGFNTQAYWFDYDLDGDQDLYLLRHSVHNDATYQTAEGRKERDSLAGDLLLRNDLVTDGTFFGLLTLSHDFTNVTTQAGLYSSKIGYGLSASVADFNQDGYPDLYVCNDFSENDYFYLNNQDGTFTEAVRDYFGHTSNFSMGSDVGDVNADGYPDLFTLDMKPDDETVLKSTMSADRPNVYNLKRELGYHHQLPQNALQWNRGGRAFSEVANISGVAASDWSWSCLLEDFDGDGATDIFVANGIIARPNSLDYLKFISSDVARNSSNREVAAQMPSGLVANRAYRNVGELAFQEVAADWGLDLVGSSTGAAVADLDRDGDPDLVLNNLNGVASIYENTSAPRKNGTDRWDPAGRWSYQRGMMSQSERRIETWRGSPIGVGEGRFGVRPAGLVLESAEDPNYFGRNRLEMAFMEERSDRVQIDTSGRILVLDANRERLTVYRYADGELKYVHDAGLPGTWSNFVGPVRLSLPNELHLREEGDYYAYPFTAVHLQEDGLLNPAASARYDLSGIWQRVTTPTGPNGAADSLILGNWGLNSPLGNPTAEEPLRLYRADIDNNGSEDPLLTYTRDGREVPVFGKDALSEQLPGIRRNKLSYREFAEGDLTDNFPNLKGQPLKVNTLCHHVLTGDLSTAQTAVATPLPRPTQITPLTAALRVRSGTLLGGNRLQVQPRIGRQDAAALQLLRPDGTVEFVDLGGANNFREVQQLVKLSETETLVVFAEGECLILTEKELPEG